MYPNASGMTITNSWLPGDYHEWVLKGPVNKENFTSWYPSLRFTDSSVVAWIQNDDDKTVAQCAKEQVWMGTPTADVASVKTDEVRLSLYPNPVNTTLYLKAEANEMQNAVITISNIVGRILYKQDKSLVKGKENELAIDVKELPAGLYSLTLTTGDNVMSRAFTIVR